MYLTSEFTEACQMTAIKKKMIRRNEQINQVEYDPPAIFRLIRCGKPRILEQGDTVLGKVKVVTTQRIACQLIYVEFKGSARVEFNVPSTTMIDEIQKFKKEWQFFNHKIPIFMHEQRGYNFLEAGVYEFYYKARVPIGGPCTFYTDIASVSYQFSAVFVRNDVTQDVLSENHLVYHVKGYKDLNKYQGARIGSWQEKVAHVGGFLGLFQGRVEIRVKTDKRAFISGETIHIVGELVNTTWRQCSFKYALVQISKMWGDHYFWRSDSWGSRHLMDSLVMEHGQGRDVESGERIFLDESFKIPKGIEPSYLGMDAKDYINDLINLEYRLEFEVVIPYSTNLRLTVPIIIGTESFMYLPAPPPPSSPGSREGEIDPLDESEEEGEKKEDHIKLEILDFDRDQHQHGLSKVPRFHPLNKHFQKKFPEVFKTGKKGVKQERTKEFTCKKRKKKHRPMCQHSKNNNSNVGKGTARVQMDYGYGLKLEECTYENWFTQCLESVPEGEEENQQSIYALRNAMRQYGLIG